MDLYIVTLTILGVVVLLTAWLPMMMKRLPQRRYQDVGDGHFFQVA